MTQGTQEYVQLNCSLTVHGSITALGLFLFLSDHPVNDVQLSVTFELDR